MWGEVGCTHYRLLKITRAYLFPASCGLRTLSALGRFWGTTYRKAWISAAQASSLQCFPPILHQIAGLWCSFCWRHVLSPLMMLGQEIFGPNGSVFQVWNVVETVKVALFLQAPRPKANNMPSPDITIYETPEWIDPILHRNFAGTVSNTYWGKGLPQGLLQSTLQLRRKVFKASSEYYILYILYNYMCIYPCLGHTFARAG